jgi:hypothetical protein
LKETFPVSRWQFLKNTLAAAMFAMSFIVSVIFSRIDLSLAIAPPDDRRLTGAEPAGSLRRPAYAAMLARVETASYQRFNAACSPVIGRPAALVAKSTVTTAVMSAAENSSPAMNGTSASLALKSV